MAVRLPDRAAGLLAYRQALKTRDTRDFEGSDACSVDQQTASARVALADAAAEHPDWRTALEANVGEPVPHGGRVLADIPGMGKVYDWRPSPWTPVNGGKIRPLLLVDHIPVVPNMPGIADFIRLRDVLVAQGLMVQCATDSSGNVALYTPLNYLCFQARGANSFSCGCEHMHLSLNETWTPRQLNAASYVHWRWRKYQGGRAYQRAVLAAGNGIVRVVQRGYTTHKEVSARAGFNDRSDPGLAFERVYERVERGVAYFDKHRTFEGFR